MRDLTGNAAPSQERRFFQRETGRSAPAAANPSMRKISGRSPRAPDSRRAAPKARGAANGAGARNAAATIVLKTEKNSCNLISL